MPPGSFAPAFATPGYPGSYPGPAVVQQQMPQTLPMQQFAPQGAPAFAVAPPTAPWNSPGVQQSSAPRPIFRAQSDDDPAPARRPSVAPRPAPLSMPTPEALGVTANRPAESQLIDWGAIHTRLNQLGTTCFQLDRPAPGVFRITCLLPTDQPGRTHRIEAQAGSETEAVRLTLAQAEEWAARR
jgi:hypothetical protein